MVGCISLLEYVGIAKYDDYRDLRKTSRLGFRSRKGKDVGWMSLTVACNQYNVKQKCDTRTLYLSPREPKFFAKWANQVILGSDELEGPNTSAE